MKRRWTPRLLALAAALVALATFPHLWCKRDAADWYHGDSHLQATLAARMDDAVETSLTPEDFTTGHELFNGEWLFGTYMMAGMGFGQIALEHPEMREASLARIETCARRMLSPEAARFDTEAWYGKPALETLDGDDAHAAYLGYANLLLGLWRVLDASHPHAEWNDQITEALVRRLESSPILLLETYPNERFPIDNAAAVGSIALYDRATGADHSQLIERWVANCRERYRDPQTGLLYQAVLSDGGRADAPRGSGTALAAYFLAHADPAFSRELYAAVRELGDSVLGFGFVREYPRHMAGGGDIDSGPVIFGYGVSATGFTLAGARMFGDEDYFGQLYATAHLFGAPKSTNQRTNFTTGGPLGNALLFAMLTAPRLNEKRNTSEDAPRSAPEAGA